MRKSKLIFVTLVPFLLAACDDGQRVPLGEQHTDRGGSSGSGLPATGGSSSLPATGGSSSLPTTGGSSSLPTTGGSSGLPTTGGSSGLPTTGGSSGLPATGGSSNTPPSTCDILTQVCNLTFEVQPYLTACVGVGVSSCMVTRTNDTGDYGNFYNGIQGFSYEWGYQYRLKVESTPVANPPADGSSVSYRLLEIVSKTPVAAGTEFDVTLAPLVHTAEDLGFVFSGDCTAGYTLFGKPLSFDAGISCVNFRTIMSATIPNSVRLRFSTPEGPLSVVGTVPTWQCSDGSPLPMSTPAQQKVTFNLRNDSSERRYIVQTGVSCNAFGVQKLAGTGATDLILRTQSPISCNGQCGRCECDAMAPFAAEILAIEPGGTHAFEWDATAYVSCQAPNPACPEEMMTVRAKQAVPPGSYRALVPITTALPTRCSPKGETDVFSCAGGGLSACVPLFACPLDKTVTVDFSMPDSGDIQVDVPIP